MAEGICLKHGDKVNIELTHASKLVIIMLTVNQREKTIKALQSFRAVSSPTFELLLWDNGSRDGTVDAVRETFPEVIVHYHPTNLGAAAGRNAAAKLALEKFRPSHLLFIDNDMTVTPNCLGALLMPFKDDTRLAQTTGKILVPNGNGQLNDAGGCRIQFWLGRTQPVGCGEIDRGQYDKPTRCVPGGFTLVRTDVFQQVGGFDPLFDPYGYEDLDFSLRISKAGYYALYVPDAVAYHEVSQTFEGGNYTEKYVSQKAKNWFLFMSRHASATEQLGFIFWGAPYRLIRAVIRETRNGNFRALVGVPRGLLDFLNSKRARG
jgi:O-antigen biosynthesis protein